MILQKIPIQEISSIAIWIPLILAGSRLRTGDTKLRLFFVFLLFGTITDGLGYIVYRFLDSEVFGIYHQILQFLYLWFEAMFFVWLAFEFFEITQKSWWKKVLRLSLILIFGIDGGLRFVILNPNYTYTSIVFSAFLVLSSFLMAFALLGLAERNGEIMSDPWFWILSGIFFYSFSCFFIDMLAYTNLGQELWRFRTILNIIQYIFFVVGLVKMNRSQ